MFAPAESLPSPATLGVSTSLFVPVALLHHSHLLVILPVRFLFINNDQLCIGVLTLMIYQHKENERALIGMTDEAIECEDNKIEAGLGWG